MYTFLYNIWNFVYKRVYYYRNRQISVQSGRAIYIKEKGKAKFYYVRFAVYKYRYYQYLFINRK